MNEALLRALTQALEAELAALPPTANEAGRVFSAKNEAQLRQAVQALQSLLAQVSLPPTAPDMPGEMAPQPPAPPQQMPVAAAPPPPPRPVPAAFARQQQAAAAEYAETVAQESVVPLSEAAVKDGKSLIRIITPGWGTSGFYSPSVLERDSPGAFPRGTKMFWDHPTTEEAAKRPERSLRDLAAELTEDARYLATGPEGPGVYSRARVFSAYQPAVEELAPHIGVSIRASALMRPGEADGKKGPIVERLIPSLTNSVDFVTIPGRGGRIASLFEAARGRNFESTEGLDMGDEAAIRAAQEATAKATQERDRALLALAMREARDVATETVAKAGLPTAAQTRLVEALAKDPAMKDGALDRETLVKAAEKAAADEKAYLSGILGTGTVRGMGSGSATEAKGPDMTADFQRLGLSEAAAKTAASGRNN